MKKTTFQQLIDSRSKYEAALLRLGIKNKHTRWTVAYDLVEQLEKARLAEKIDELDKKLLGRMRFALTDLDNLELILDQFKNDQSTLFKQKFEKMLGGADDQTQENHTNSHPRNTQLELVLCARFREVGLDAELHDPHPDIVVSVNGRKYGFECKRIYSEDPSSVEENVSKAIKQLNEHYLDDDFSKRGMPILCIDRHVTGGDKVLNAKDEDTSRDRLGYEIEQFVTTHRRHWAGIKKAKQERLVGVVIYMNVTTILKTENMQATSRQSGANNSGWTRWGEQMFKEFIGDIGKHLGPLDIITLDS